MLAAIVLGSISLKTQLSEKLAKIVLWPVAALGAVTLLATPSNVAAAAQWWVQVVLLAAFVVTLAKLQVSSSESQAGRSDFRTIGPIPSTKPLEDLTRSTKHKARNAIASIVFWFVLSLLPCVIAVAHQVLTQNVWGWSWLGVAAQDPSSLGVSVVQTGGLRWLRAYGIFPHPNILGAWSALGVLCATHLYLTAKRQAERAAWLIVQTAFVTCLFYSFSRAAWLAAAMGLVAMAFSLARTLPKDEWRRLKVEKRLAIFVVPLLAAACLTVANGDLVWTRATVQASRTERISLDVRAQSLRDGLAVYAAYPFFGTGPSNYLPALATAKNLTTSPAPLEPPHLVWLLALAETGTVGFAAIWFALASVGVLLRKSRRTADARLWSLALAAAAAWTVALLFDHYAWSLWSGQTLTALVVFLVLAATPTNEKAA